MPTYIGRDKLNSAANIWFEGLSIELRIFRLLTWTTLEQQGVECCKRCA